MKTKNTYYLPIDLNKVVSTQTDSIAHVGDLVHAIDYDAPEGTPVCAALSGVVLSVKDDSSIGGDDPKYEDRANYIELLHTHDEISEYEHLRYHSSRVREGDRVSVGDTLAEVGSTGWSECPHLHFMVYPNDGTNQTREIQFRT